MERPRDDSGFTLVEILVGISILGIIMLSLGAAWGIGIRGIDSTSNRFASSNDAQFVSVYFPPDVQSASTAATNGISCPNAGNARILLTSNDNGSGARTVAYWVRGVAGGGHELVRSVWNAANCSGAPANSVVVARNLGGLRAATAACATPTCRLTVTGKTTTTDANAYRFTVTGKMRAPA